MNFGQDFLIDPDRFPQPSTGESCGAITHCIEMVGGPYELRGLSEIHAPLSAGSFGPALVDGNTEQPTVEVEVVSADEALFHQIDISRWDYTFDLDPAEHHLLLAGRNFFARIALQPTITATLWLNEDPNDAGFAIQNTMRVLVAHRLVELGGVLLHSSCVVDEDRAFLFFGPSNAGKSTMAALAADNGTKVLGDDMNLILTAAEEPRVELFPLSGDRRFVGHGRESYPLAGAYRLRQNNHEASSALGPAQAFASLFACAPYLNNDPHREERLAHTLRSIAAAVPVGELHFRRDATWDQIRPCLEEYS